jgi:predicted metal-binding membrane protein
MWSVMMAAMMLPSATPMLLSFAALNQKRGEGARSLYFVAPPISPCGPRSARWQPLLNGRSSQSLLSPMIVSTSAVFSGALLVIAGLFQFTPLKHTCLRACRSPFGFLLSDWNDGLWGAWRMGIRHGLYCLGCCWALMALLFVGAS